MAKHKKKKKHAKSDDLADDLFSGAALSIKKFRQVTNEIARLSTGQKLVGGVALLAAGALYLQKLRQDAGGPGFSLQLPRFSSAPGLHDDPDAGTAAEEVARPRRSGKPAKGSKGSGYVRRPISPPGE